MTAAKMTLSKTDAKPKGFGLSGLGFRSLKFGADWTATRVEVVLAFEKAFELSRVGI